MDFNKCNGMLKNRLTDDEKMFCILICVKRGSNKIFIIIKIYVKNMNKLIARVCRNVLTVLTTVLRRSDSIKTFLEVVLI